MIGRNILAVFFLVYGALFWLHSTDGNAVAGMYSDSAHGNTEYGVERTGLSGTYVKGNCAHCHEQHASIGGDEPDPDSDAPAISALFHNTFNTTATDPPYTVSDLFCFYCHSDISLESIQHDAAGDMDMKNYDYSYTFGGCNIAIGGPLVDDLLETFNWPSYSSTGSSHNLSGLQTYTNTNFPTWFGPNSDPCTACHNPHIARRNKKNLHDPSFSTISLPSDHKNHWGDESDEQMSDYANNYRAPYTWNSTILFEPDRSSISDGDLIPDYNTFCLDCHGVNAGAINSLSHGRNLVPIDWSGSAGDTPSAGDKHGTNIATGQVDTKGPYFNTDDLVLSCCDCHEPHGSPYDFLMRRAINGQAVGAIGLTIGDRGNQCRQCHKDDQEFGGGADPNVWKFTHHGASVDVLPGGVDNPYFAQQVPDCGCHAGGRINPIKKIPCEDCHYHGSYIQGGTATTPVYTDPSDGIDTIYVPSPKDDLGRKTF